MTNAVLAQRIREEYKHLIWYYRLKLKPATIVIDDDLTAQWGLWDPEQRLIKLSPLLFYQYRWPVAIEVLKHEMAHQIVTEVFQVVDGHGPFFKRAASMLSLADWAKRAAIGRSDLEAVSSRDDLNDEEKRLLRRTEKLLALGQSPNQNEAKLAMQRVHELYLSHNIEMIKARKKASFTSSQITLRRKRLGMHYAKMIEILNQFYFVDVVQCDWYCPKDNENYKAYDVMGAHENVVMAEYVFHFLEGAMERAWQDYRKRMQRSACRDRTSYLIGFLTGFSDQLSQNLKSPSSAVVTDLVRLDDPLLRAFVKERHPRLRTNKYCASGAGQESYQNGRMRGRTTNMAKPLRNAGQSSAPSGLLLT